MLIASPRHTDADLALWAELERADRLHAAAGQARQVERARAAIRRFAGDGPCYAGVSWGKDSVVLAHLARAAGVPLVWVRVAPIANPDCRLVRDAFLDRWPSTYHEIEVWCRHSAGEWHARGTLEAGFARAEATVAPRYLSGIRADESSGRKISMARHGLATARSCRPLAWWTAAAVFAYLARHDLPVHPAYAMLGGGRWPRQHLRVASLGGTRGQGHGRREWEMEYYGDVLRRQAAA